MAASILNKDSRNKPLFAMLAIYHLSTKVALNCATEHNVCRRMLLGAFMPQEFRYVLFTSEELSAALVYDLRACRRTVPPGFVKSIILEDGVTISATLMSVMDNGCDMPIRFEHHEILRALIVYCGHRKIPLPAKATKSLEIRKNRIALLCVITPKETLRPEKERIETVVSRPATEATPPAHSKSIPAAKPRFSHIETR